MGILIDSQLEEFNNNGFLLVRGIIPQNPRNNLLKCFKILFNKYVKYATITKPIKNNKPFTIALFNIESITMKNVSKKGDIIVKNVNKFVNENVIAAACLEIFKSELDVGLSIIIYLLY